MKVINLLKSRKTIWVGVVLIAVAFCGGIIFCLTRATDQLSPTSFMPTSLWTETLPLITSGNEKKAGHLMKAELKIFDAEKCAALGKHDAAVEAIRIASDEMRQCFGEKSFSYATILTRQADMEQKAGLSKASIATSRQALAAMPAEGTQVFVIMLCDKLATDLVDDGESKSADVLSLRQRSVAASEQLYSKGKNAAVFLLPSLASQANDQEGYYLTEQAYTTLSRELQVLQEDSGKGQWRNVDCLINLGRVELKTGRYEQADKHLHQAIDWFVKNPKTASEGWGGAWYANAYDILAKSFVRRGNFVEAEKYFRQAIEIACRSNNDPVLCFQDLARLLRHQGKFKESEKVLQEGLTRLPHPDKSDRKQPLWTAAVSRAPLLQDLAVTAALQGDSAKAITYLSRDRSPNSIQKTDDITGSDFDSLNKAGRLPKAALGADIIAICPTRKEVVYPLYVLTHQQFKCLLQGIALPLTCKENGEESAWQKQIDQAERHDYDKDDGACLLALKAALADAQGGGSADLRLADTLEKFGHHYNHVGKLIQAESYLRQAVQAYEKQPDQYRDPVSFGFCLRELGESLYWQKKYELAGPVFSRCLSVTALELGDDHITVTVARFELAANLLAQGKLDQARQLYLQILAEADKSSGSSESYNRDQARAGLAKVCFKQSKFDQSEKYCLEILGEKNANPEAKWKALRLYALVLDHSGRQAEAAKKRAEAEKMRLEIGPINQTED